MFVIVNPFIISPVTFAVYPSGTAVSSTVYFIVVPSCFSGKSVNVCFQLFVSFNVISFPDTAIPSANSLTVISVGLILSWSFLSSHTFSTDTLITPGVCVFVIMNPVVASPVVSAEYPVGVDVSSTVYVIFVPFEYTGKSVNVYFQLFDSSNITVFPDTAIPSANNFTVIFVVLNPS